MPIQAGYNVAFPGITDLKTASERTNLLKQQQNMANINQILQMFQMIKQYQEKEKEKANQRKVLESIGVIKEVPETKKFEPSDIKKYKENLLMFSPEAQEQLRSFAEEGSYTIPTGGMKTQYDFSNIPEGFQFDIPGTGGIMKYKGLSPTIWDIMDKQKSGITIDAEGNPAINIDGNVIPISSISKSGFKAKTDTSGKNKIYKNKEDIPDELNGLPLKTITPTMGGFKASYGGSQDVFDIMNRKSQDDNARKQAIDALTKSGYPTTEANIKAAMEQLKGK